MANLVIEIKTINGFMPFDWEVQAQNRHKDEKPFVIMRGGHWMAFVATPHDGLQYAIQEVETQISDMQAAVNRAKEYKA